MDSSAYVTLKKKKYVKFAEWKELGGQESSTDIMGNARFSSGL